MEIMKPPTLFELKASAYDCAIQVKAWQDKLNDYTNQINNYMEPEKEVPEQSQNGLQKEKK